MSEKQDATLRQLGQVVIDKIVAKGLIMYRQDEEGENLFVWGVDADLEIGKAVISAGLKILREES